MDSKTVAIVTASMITSSSLAFVAARLDAQSRTAALEQRVAQVEAQLKAEALEKQKQYREAVRRNLRNERPPHPPAQAYLIK
jgi:hypothetical protein